MCALQFYMLFYVLVYRNVGVVANRGVIHTLQKLLFECGSRAMDHVLTHPSVDS